MVPGRTLPPADDGIQERRLLLFDSNDEIRAKVFTWGDVTADQLQQYDTDLRRWGVGNVHMLLSDQQLHSLAERKRGWLWNGYELIQMRNAGVGQHSNPGIMPFGIIYCTIFPEFLRGLAVVWIAKWRKFLRAFWRMRTRYHRVDRFRHLSGLQKTSVNLLIP